MKKLTLLLILILSLSLFVSCGKKETGEDGTISTEKDIVLNVVDDEEQVENILEAVHIALADESITEAKEYSDNVGRGMQMKMDSGRVINVYTDKTGFVYGIKDVKTEEYLYAVYE